MAQPNIALIPYDPVRRPPFLILREEENYLCRICHKKNIQISPCELSTLERDIGNMEDNSWKNVLTSSLYKAWKEDLYTDITIVTDGETFRAHKLILVAASPYFKALCSADLSEGSSSCLRLDNTDSETFKIILTYIYSGKAMLDRDTVVDILQLSDYFQIQNLKRLCCMYIKANLSTRMCLAAYEIALLHRCHDLANHSFEMALKHCSDVIKDPSFLRLQPSTIAALLKQPILEITSEDELFKALTEWAAFMKEERCNDYLSLLSLLHEKQMNPVMRAVYREKLEEGPINTSIPYDGFLTTGCQPITSRHKKEEELIFVFGGESNGRTLGNSECIALGWTSWCCSIPSYADEAERISELEGQRVIPSMTESRTYPAIAVKDNTVYIIGGQASGSFIRSCETYHIETNEWKPFPELPLYLHGEEAIFLQDCLWVVGGRNSTEPENQNVLLMYDPNKEKWTFRNPMSEGRVHFGVSGIHGNLYVIGGMGLTSSNNHKTLSCCEKYDVETDTWVSIAPLNQRRAYHRVAVIDDYLYAIGGYDGHKWLNSVERYDPLKDRWTNVSPMIGTRSSFGVTVSHGRIYSIGGFSGESVLNTVEKYNPRTDMWHCVQSMRLRRYGVVAATLKLPSEKVTSDHHVSRIS